MTHDDLLPALRKRGLNAWQAEFAAAFLASDSPRLHILAAPTGAGRIRASVEIAAELLAGGGARVLVVSPASVLAEQWKALLEQAQQSAQVSIVTSRRLRELEGTLPAHEAPWAERGVYVITPSTAAAIDVASSLARVTWDLVILDEAQPLADVTYSHFLEALLASDSVRRLLVLTGTPSRAEPWYRWLLSRSGRRDDLPPPVELTSWFRTLRDWEGLPAARPEVKWSLFSYNRGSDEIGFLQLLSELTPSLQNARGRDRLFPKSLTRRASSSLFAIEQYLRRMVQELERLTAKEGRPGVGTDREESLSGSLEEPKPSWVAPSAGIGIAERLLEALETVHTDAKRDALKQLLHSIIGSGHGHFPRICVLSGYRDTVSYLSAAFEDGDLPLFRATGSDSFAERRATVESFLTQGGLILGTDVGILGAEAGVSDGIGTAQVTHVVHYDLPGGRRSLEQRRGEFDRAGRVTPLAMWAFRDNSQAIPSEGRLLNSIQPYLKGGGVEP